MRSFARGHNSDAKARTPAEDASTAALVNERINRSMRRRMSDDLVSLIRRACLCGHAETAKGLWIVLRDLAAREAQQGYPNGRPLDGRLLETLAVEIATAARDSKPAV